MTIIDEPEYDPPAWQRRRPDEGRHEYAERMLELARAHLAGITSPPKPEDEE